MYQFYMQIWSRDFHNSHASQRAKDRQRTSEKYIILTGNTKVNASPCECETQPW